MMNFAGRSLWLRRPVFPAWCTATIWPAATPSLRACLPVIYIDCSGDFWLISAHFDWQQKGRNVPSGVWWVVWDRWGTMLQFKRMTDFALQWKWSILKKWEVFWKWSILYSNDGWMDAVLLFHASPSLHSAGRLGAISIEESWFPIEESSFPIQESSFPNQESSFYNKNRWKTATRTA